MKKHAIVTMALAIALAVPLITPAAEAPQSEATTESEGKEYTFRGIPWGSSLAEVENSEFVKDHPDFTYTESEGKLTITDATVAGKSSAAVLCFGNNGLYSGMYILSEKHTDLINYYQDFLDLQESLTKKYGEPDETDDDWKNDLYKDNPSKYGMAIGAGHVKFIRRWKGNDSVITLGCVGDNFEISNAIYYQSLSLQPKETEDDGL